MNSLTDIISKLESNDFTHLVYVGKNYTKQDLIRDLMSLKKGALETAGDEQARWVGQNMRCL